jgi:hypothetical protein
MKYKGERMRKRRPKNISYKFVTREYIDKKYNPEPKPKRFCKLCSKEVLSNNKYYCSAKCKHRHYYLLYQKPKLEEEKHRNTYLNSLSDEDFYNEVCIPLRDNLRVKE